MHYMLTDNERNAIQTVIGYKAEQLRLPSHVFEQSVCRLFRVENLRELATRDFDGVIRHLLEWPL